MNQYVEGAPSAVGRSLKPSLADCCPTGPARSPKNVANPDSTRLVAASSLSVSGNSSNSGSRRLPDAWHSARTIRSMAPRIVLRVPRCHSDR
ncbi:hypothetical protein [Blastococcus mobilis]|uniref:hypothetical protein n=1 Tax=Blastococcus mobilis TaxID=1938746 RepID=UPI0015950ACC|nr:hypothetical protein [Blastococcus mobilis]